MFLNDETAFRGEKCPKLITMKTDKNEKHSVTLRSKSFLSSTVVSVVMIKKDNLLRLSEKQTNPRAETKTVEVSDQ